MAYLDVNGPAVCWSPSVAQAIEGPRYHASPHDMSAYCPDSVVMKMDEPGRVWSKFVKRQPTPWHSLGTSSNVTERSNSSGSPNSSNTSAERRVVVPECMRWADRPTRYVVSVNGS